MQRTIQEHLKEESAVAVRCERCQAIRPLDLVGLAAFGHGNVSLGLLRVHCPECHERAQLVVQPATPNGPGAFWRAN